MSAALLVSGFGLSAQTVNEFTLQVNKLGAEIPSTLYGHFLEDINFGADGGMYAELIKNRSFEFPQTFMGWEVFGNVTVKDDGPFERCPHYVHLEAPNHKERRTGLINHGFFGIGLKKDATYKFSVWARGEGQKLRVQLIDKFTAGPTQIITGEDITIDSSDWKKYEVTFTSPITIDKAQLRLMLKSDGGLDLEHVSLFPTDTWMGRENGLRKDIVQALADTKPGVFRFPGGCIVEGTDLASRYQWKNTVGPVENRPLNENRWHFTFEHHFFPDYFQSGGLGFYEMFQLAEDIGAEPLPILFCGLVCQYQNDEESAHVPVDQLEPLIQDALDLIEFANGDTSTEWGKLRADMGHPEPFNMKFIGIGNEQWGPGYPARLKPFVDAIRKAYPEMKIVGSSGPQSEGEDFEYLWPEMTKLKVDLVDEHFYRPQGWFLASGNRYDNYDRKAPKVFAGEYACHYKGKGYNNFEAALLEAAFLTGVERNADVVEMATFAPLLAHAEGWQWRPDLIWFDNLRVMRSCSWHVQCLFSTNKGSKVVPILLGDKPAAGNEGQNGLFASAVWDEPTSTYIIKVVNTSKTAQPLSFTFKGLKKKATLSNGTVTTFHSDDLDAENTLDEPEKIVPMESELAVDGTTVNAEIGQMTFAVYKIKMQGL